MTVHSFRPATPADAPALAAIYLAARADRCFFPPLAHPGWTVEAFLRDHMLPRCEVRLALVGDAPAGFIGIEPGWVHHLYLHPAHHRRGLGATLMDWAKSTSRGGLDLWCFQRNTPARAFYAAQAFQEIERTDGADNEEREPDVRLAWRPS